MIDSADLIAKTRTDVDALKAMHPRIHDNDDPQWGNKAMDEVLRVAEEQADTIAYLTDERDAAKARERRGEHRIDRRNEIIARLEKERDQYRTSYESACRSFKAATDGRWSPPEEPA